MKRLIKLFSILAITAVLAAVSIEPYPIAAQDAIEVVNQSWDADFRDHITFNLEAESPAEIIEVDLFYRVVGQIASSRNDAEFSPGMTVEAEYELDQTDPTNYQPPGTELEYWWKVVDAEGNELKTEPETLLYLDDRYDWSTLENERVALFWYEGDDGFGQALFDRANDALDTLEQDFGAAIENQIKIFIYGNQQDLLNAIRAGSQEWTGGQAFTEYGVVVIGVRPGQLEWGLNAMTHEMSHLVIHQVTDNPFSDLPRWLDEGIAVYNENRNELDDDFRPIFERAVDDNELMTLRTLSSPFPADPVKANLSYGQSGAVVRFMIDTYGPEAMANLLDIFSEGALYDEALEQAIGTDTVGLDNAFRESLGVSPLPGTEEAGEEAAGAELSTTDEEAASGESELSVEAEAAPETSQEAAVSAESESGAEPESGEISTEESDSPLAALPCLAGVLTLLMMGGAVYGLRR